MFERKGDFIAELCSRRSQLLARARSVIYWLWVWFQIEKHSPEPNKYGPQNAKANFSFPYVHKMKIADIWMRPSTAFGDKLE
jgi:hypothetical protein